MNNYIDQLNWRYATKKFDASKKVSTSDLELLKEAVQLSASSYGLQPYKILVVEDEKVKQQLREAGYGQSQFTDASHIFVFTHRTDFGEELVDSYISHAERIQEIEEGSLKDYEKVMKNSLMDLPQEAKSGWSARQAYLAIGNLLSAAAMFKIDACPMEGFDADAFDKILDLKDQNLHAVAVVAVGYRSEDDKHQYDKKVRRPQAELFETI
ncbi:NAD(P)H-dependent oxidoreductase [Flavimarina sp. Hel_I_48]|uniref:NAD(P)H-dependent oxidoreductase n=1 Tax=Flavimarina sp. Hel_I_48 TaxID=1392488 RepID=UPI0004DF1777|nr:NAD(P)H-dependent oxidoreductase [Flavimarina sp. Hel_I_48]